MISHQPSRKNSIARHRRSVPELELLEHRQLLSTAHAIPSYNLTGSFLPVTLPRELAGQHLTGSLTVAVKNTGTIALPGNQKITLSLIAHSASRNVTLETSTALSVSNLAGNGGSKNFSFDLTKATIPPVGDYTLEAQITPTPSLTESSKADNLITTTAAGISIALHVAAPDLTGTLLPSSLPALVLAGNKNPVAGSLTVQVQNNGNIALPAGEQITLQIRAHNAITGKNYILNANANQKYSVSNLGIGQTLNISPNLQFTGQTFPAGSYTLQALITPVQAITESSTANNLVTVNAAGQPTTLVSQTAAAPDLTGLFVTSTVQSDANGTTGNLTITLTNAGTATLVGPQPIAFAITARPTGITDLAVSVATLSQNFSVSNLKVGQSATFTVTLSDTQLGNGIWLLTAGINAPGLTGPTTGNLIAVTKSGGLVTVNSVFIAVLAGPPILQLPVSPIAPVVPIGNFPITITPINLNPITPIMPVNPIIIEQPTPITQLPPPVITPPFTGFGTITTLGGTPGGVLTLGGANGSTVGGVLTIENSANLTNAMPVVPFAPVKNLFTDDNGVIETGALTLSNVTITGADGTQTQPFDAADVQLMGPGFTFSNFTLAGAPVSFDISAAVQASSNFTISGTLLGNAVTLNFATGTPASNGTLTVNGNPTTLPYSLVTLTTTTGDTVTQVIVPSAFLLSMNLGNITLPMLPPLGSTGISTLSLNGNPIEVNGNLIFGNPGEQVGNITTFPSTNTDLSVVLNNFGTASSQWTTGNFNGTAIDLTNLAAILAQFGATSPPAS